MNPPKALLMAPLSVALVVPVMPSTIEPKGAWISPFWTMVPASTSRIPPAESGVVVEGPTPVVHSRAMDSRLKVPSFGEPFAFDVPVQPSALRVPLEPLEFARTAAGFWNTTLSPLEAAQLSAIVARDGEAVRPSVVDKVVAADGTVTLRDGKCELETARA